MKIKDGYLLREVAGTPVVVPLSSDTTFRNILLSKTNFIKFIQNFFF